MRALGTSISIRGVAAVAALLVGLGGCGTTAAPDAATGGEDAPPRCARDPECDDGVFCNGAERCAPSDPGARGDGCAPAAAPACEAPARCDEAAAECVTGCAVADADGDGEDAIACGGVDCDDSDPARSPAALEVCDAADVDEDCDPASAGARDADADGHDDDACCNGAVCGDDCDDARADVHAGLAEACDGRDNDCDGASDEGVELTYRRDADGDGFGDPAGATAVGCEPPAGFAALATDCDDARGDRNPAAPEVCDVTDNDCDGAVDESVRLTFYADVDGDDFGDPDGATVSACSAPSGFARLPTDCDDTRADRNPAAPEVCDVRDNDCDAIVDEGASPATWYRDSDGDGFGAASSGTTTSCTPPAMHSLLGTDCDDARASVNPAAAERCDALDDDCNGALDGPGEDDDGDGSADVACGGADCDDTTSTIRPGAPEICDRRDDDCSSGGGAVPAEDLDDDGFAPLSPPCSGGPRAPLDCDDTRSAVRPGATDVCNLRDDDCDGTVDPDPLASASCSLPFATAECRAGRCAIAGCLGTRRDCDLGAANGCEADIASDVATCGSCTTACGAPARTTMRCSSGTCSVASCDPLWDDCDGAVPNGCETALTTATDCGACGIACDFANATETCATASCSRISCDALWDDCNAAPGDGCERSLATLTDCGACGVACSRANATATCAGGACAIGACDAGYASCTGGDADGCETQISTSLAHCGACGAACVVTGATCDGACHPRPVWARALAGTGADHVFDVAIDAAGNAYVVGTSDQIQTIDFGGAPAVRVGGFDGFVASYSPSGALRWRRTFGTLGYDSIHAVAVEGARVVIGGTVTGALDVGGGLRPAGGDADAIVVGLAAADGAWAWDQRFASTGFDTVDAVGIEASGGVAIAGSWVAGAPLTIGATTLPGDGSSPKFVARLDASGSPLWVRGCANVSGHSGSVLAVELDPAGIVTASGSFRRIDLGAGEIVAATGGSDSDAFVVSYAPDGAHRWTRTIATMPSLTPRGSFSSIALLGGDVVVSGFGAGIVDFGGGPVDLGSGARHAARYTSVGSYVWAITEPEVGGSIAADGATLYSAASSSPGLPPYLASRTAAGARRWSYLAPGANPQAIDAAGGAVVVGGYMLGTVTFGSTTLTDSVGTDSFVGVIVE